MFPAGNIDPSILRQSNDRQDRYATADDSNANQNGNFKYTQLVNRSYSDESLNSSSSGSATNNNLNVNGHGSKMVKSTSDQKIPEFGGGKEFVYVNKNGFPTMSQILSPNSKKEGEAQPNSLNCKNLVLEMYKNNKENLNDELKKANLNPNQHFDQLSLNNHSVPNHNHLQDMSNSLNDSRNSNAMVQRDNNGNIIINTNMAIQEPNLDISQSHVKYVNIFSILCCWCFPLTGIFSIIYARMTKKYYNTRDLVNAKKYLGKSEWCLILTFFFGFTLIAILFCVLEFYWFKTGALSKTHAYHFPRSFPK
jgi:hypothetical protein